VPYAQGDRKICSACRAELPLSGFGRNRAQKDGLANQCKKCLQASRTKSFKKDPRRFRRLQLNSYRRYKYGISVAEYDSMVAEVNGQCPICGSPPKPPFTCLAVDHCHASGRVRGVLCHGCNTALGQVQDDPAILRALADYVEAHNAIAAEHGPISRRPLPPLEPRRSEDHPKAKLTAPQVREIRGLVLAGVKQADIGQRFGITQAHVSLIALRRTWKHLPDATAENAAAARQRWDEEHTKE